MKGCEINFVWVRFLQNFNRYTIREITTQDYDLGRQKLEDTTLVKIQPVVEVLSLKPVQKVFAFIKGRVVVVVFNENYRDKQVVVGLDASVPKGEVHFVFSDQRIIQLISLRIMHCEESDRVLMQLCDFLIKVRVGN